MVNSLFWGTFKTTPSFNDYLGESPRTQHIVLLMTMIDFSNGTQGTDSRVKGPGVNLKEAWRTVPERLPADPHRTCCTPPAARYGNTSEMVPTKETQERLMEAFLCLAHVKVPDSQKEAYVRYKPRCLNKSFRHSESFLSGNGGNAPEIHISRPHPRASLACEQAFLKSAFLFLHSLLPQPRCLHRRSASSIVLGPHAAG